jgi:ArsR family transcriptional regulator, lead/cadmium/zinc/bismuth-responsive transcriptional repressor
MVKKPISALESIPEDEICHELIELMKVLAEPNRFKIIEIIYHYSEHSVTTLAELLDISQPAASQHLKILKQSGLVNYRKDGRKMLYSIDHNEIKRRYGKAIELLYQYFTNEYKT